MKIMERQGGRTQVESKPEYRLYIQFYYEHFYILIYKLVYKNPFINQKGNQTKFIETR